MTETQALDITVYEPMAVMPVLDIRAAIVRQQALTDFVSKIMHENTDFGTIPGTDKPTLLKPGAEKLTTFFGLSKRFVLVERTEDWTGANHSGEPFFYYLYRCQLYGRNNTLIAEADGSASSWESKYRYRNSERVCPSCGKAAIIKGKAEYGGGWLCFNKKGGCGAKFADKDKQITEQITGKVPNPDPADTVNTILKMSQKRALIAATLLAVNASEFFTQDMEDFVDADYTVHNSQPAPVVKVERPAPAGPAWTPDPNGFDDLPSASAERNGANGKTTPASAHDPAAPWDDNRKAEAVRWAMRRYPEVYNHVKPWQLSLDHLLEKAASEGMDAAQIAQAWKDKCAGKQDELDAKKLQATLDAQAAGDEMPVFESR